MAEHRNNDAAKAKAFGAIVFWSLVALLPGVGVLVLLWIVVKEFTAVRSERGSARIGRPPRSQSARTVGLQPA